MDKAKTEAKTIKPILANARTIAQAQIVWTCIDDADNPVCLSKIVRASGITKSCTQRALKMLRRTGCIEMMREGGSTALYAAIRPPLMSMFIIGNDTACKMRLAGHRIIDALGHLGPSSTKREIFKAAGLEDENGSILNNLVRRRIVVVSGSINTPGSRNTFNMYSIAPGLTVESAQALLTDEKLLLRMMESEYTPMKFPPKEAAPAEPAKVLPFPRSMLANRAM